MKTWALVAVAAMGLTACQNDFEEQVEAKDSVVVTFVADSADTRTSVDTSGDTPVFTWDEVENFYVLEQTADTFEAVNTDQFELKEGKAHITAEFAANPGKGEYKYVTIYPEDGYVDATDINNATLTLPAEQEMLTPTSYGVSDLMVSEVVITEAQPTEAQLVRFTRLAAVVQLTLKNLSEEEQIESVTFEAAGKHLAGEIDVDLENPHDFRAGDVTSSSVTVTPHNDTTNEIYFTVLPTSLAEGDSYTVTVVTNNKIYIKQGTIPAEKSLVFKSGMVTRVGVNMMGVVGYDKWTLVTDASDLKQGDVVTIVANNYNCVIGKQGGNYPLASQTEIVKGDNYFYHPVTEDNKNSADHILQKYTLVARDGGFDFYNGKDYEGDTSIGFVWATGNNYAPKLQAYCNNDTWFSVNINEGVATIKADKIEKSNKWWRYYHSTTVTSRKFDMTTSEPTGNNTICIYRLEGAVGTIPTVAANVTVPAADKPVVIAEEGATTATAIEEVVFNYVGPWTISVSDNAEWLEVSYADGKLYYTAEENTGVKRDAVATITASLEGKESLTWSFNVVQKGVPQEITIAEFMSKKSDVNTTYKLTGKITEMTSSSSGTYKLSDGTNEVTVTYLYTDGGDKVYGDDSIGLKVGDVVTVTTVAATSTAGKGGSSAYHSIYKGHYGLDTSTGVAADYTGGDVNIEVETYSNGTITLPASVVATMPQSDYATLSYDGGDTATVTFTSENTTSDAREATVTFTYGLISVEVTVQQGVNPANKIGFELVTDVSTLAVGDEVIIVAKNADKAIACPTSTSATSFPAAAIKKTGNVIYDVEEAGVQVFTLGAGVSEGTMSFDFTYKEVGYRLYYSSGLKIRATSYAVNAATSWTIEINAVDGDATITSTRLIKFNSTGGTTFTCYASTNANATKAENAVCIYKKQTK